MPHAKSVTKTLCLHRNDAASLYKDGDFREGVISSVNQATLKHFAAKPGDVVTLFTLCIQ